MCVLRQFIPFSGLLYKQTISMTVRYTSIFRMNQIKRIFIRHAKVLWVNIYQNFSNLSFISRKKIGTVRCVHLHRVSNGIHSRTITKWQMIQQLSKRVWTREQSGKEAVH